VEHIRVEVQVRNADNKLTARLFGGAPTGLVEFVDRRLYTSEMTRPLLVVPPGGRLEMTAE